MRPATESLTKAIVYRMASTAVTFAVALLITGSVSSSTGIAALEFVVKAAGYFAFERAWERVRDIEC